MQILDELSPEQLAARLQSRRAGGRQLQEAPLFHASQPERRRRRTGCFCSSGAICTLRFPTSVSA